MIGLEPVALEEGGDGREDIPCAFFFRSRTLGGLRRLIGTRYFGNGPEERSILGALRLR